MGTICKLYLKNLTTTKCDNTEKLNIPAVSNLRAFLYS